MKKNESINTSAKIIIPKKWITPSVEKKKEEILDNLNSISDFEIENVGTDIECQKIIKQIRHGRGTRLSMNDIDLLINNWYLRIISGNLQSFDKSRYKQIALKMVDKAKEQWREHIRADFLYNFKNYGLNLDDEIALKLIKCWYAQVIIDYIKDFDYLSKEVAISLYDKTGSYIPLKHFKEEDRKDIALFYIEKWEYFYLEGIDGDVNFANQILWLKNKNKFRMLCENIERFPSKLHKEIALNIINAWWDAYLLSKLHDFEWMDKEIAVALWERWSFTTDLKKYTSEARQDVALYLLDKKEHPSLHNVPRLNLDFANKIIEKKEFVYLINNIEYFFERDHKQIFLNLTNAWYYSFSHDILYKFKWKDKEVAMILLNYRKTKGDTSMLNYFASYIAINTNEFTGLDDEVASELIDLWFWEQVKKQKKSYKDLSIFTKMRLLMK